MENVILVSPQNEELGIMEKLEAHKKGLLHRAFSIYLFNEDHQLLLQKRAEVKYHSGSLWSNTCCGHPRPKEDVMDAAKRRLKEEMGLEANLLPISTFIYKAQLNNGLTEHEYLHVFIGITRDDPVPNPDEVEDWRFLQVSSILQDFQLNPSRYSEWFKITLPLIKIEHQIK